MSELLTKCLGGFVGSHEPSAIAIDWTRNMLKMMLKWGCMGWLRIIDLNGMGSHTSHIITSCAWMMHRSEPAQARMKE